MTHWAKHLPVFSIPIVASEAPHRDDVVNRALKPRHKVTADSAEFESV
jgi:hypothetical protein